MPISSMVLQGMYKSQIEVNSLFLFTFPVENFAKKVATGCVHFEMSGVFCWPEKKACQG